jgi:hypothetical protein
MAGLWSLKHQRPACRHFSTMCNFFQYVRTAFGSFTPFPSGSQSKPMMLCNVWHQYCSSNPRLVIPDICPVGNKKGQNPNHVAWSEFTSNGKIINEQVEESSISYLFFGHFVLK